MKLECHLGKDSIFYKLGQHGLISFSDYMFLLVVLSSKWLSSHELSLNYFSADESSVLLRKIMFEYNKQGMDILVEYTIKP